MLLASPQERRTIFEEAAGIAKFKQRRIESQRKLDRPSRTWSAPASSSTRPSAGCGS
jgi:chromosome segregation ATPase